MTDYTPEQLEEMSKKARELTRGTQVAEFVGDIAKDTAKALAEYPRLKEERDDLLKALKTTYGLARLKCGNLDPDIWQELEKTRELIERIDRE